jgi:hypothetical protein
VRIYAKEAGGSGRQEELISEGTVLNTVDDWSRDGQYLLYHAAARPTPISLIRALHERRAQTKKVPIVKMAPDTAAENAGLHWGRDHLD